MNHKTTITNLLRYAAVFFLTLLILAGMLIASELIPKESMKANMLRSAEKMCEKEVFFDLNEGITSSKIDRYADSILLSIAYHTDTEHPVKAAMWSSYYSTFYANENDNFLASLTKDLAPNQQYLRYWHGSAVFVRLFHLFTDINGMYVFHMVLLAALIIVLCISLVKAGLKEVAVVLSLGGIGTAIWYVPFSLEYTWTVLLGLEAMLVALLLWKRKKESVLGLFFMAVGMITAYLDFLTTETLTLTLPLILLLILRKDDADQKGWFSFTITKCIAWGIGYIGMWVMKWIIAALILQENVMPYVTEHIAERLGTTAPEYIPLLETVQRNIICLFPMMFGTRFDIVVIVVMVVWLCCLYLFRKKSFHTAYVVCMTVIGLLPWIRYCLLRNHSYLHYFFTYRAQLATIMSLCLITYEMMDWNYLKRKFEKK